MEIRNAIYKTVPVRNLTFPLAAGTVVTAGGTLANSDGSDAYGIVPETVALLPLTKRLYVAVAGTIDLATCGVTFTDTMIKALGEDINFVPAKEEHEPPAPELPVVDSGDNGKILKVVSGEWAAANASSGGTLLVDIEYGESTTLNKTYAEISAALAAGVTPVVREADPQYEGVTRYWTIIETDTRDGGYTVSVYSKIKNNTSTYGSQTENGTLTYMDYS